MALNTIKLFLSNLFIVVFFACNTKTKHEEIKVVNTDTCKYSRYDAHQAILNLGCQNCHAPYGKRIGEGFVTFSELAAMDSLKLVDYAFTNKHKGWYGETGTFKTARMDTLTDCEIKGAIRYIKDHGRSIAIPGQ